MYHALWRLQKQHRSLLIGAQSELMFSLHSGVICDVDSFLIGI